MLESWGRGPQGIDPQTFDYEVGTDDHVFLPRLRHPAPPPAPRRPTDHWRAYWSATAAASAAAATASGFPASAEQSNDGGQSGVRCHGSEADDGEEAGGIGYCDAALLLSGKIVTITVKKLPM